MFGVKHSKLEDPSMGEILNMAPNKNDRYAGLIKDVKIFLTTNDITIFVSKLIGHGLNEKSPFSEIDKFSVMKWEMHQSYENNEIQVKDQDRKKHLSENCKASSITTFGTDIAVGSRKGTIFLYSANLKKMKIQSEGIIFSIHLSKSQLAALSQINKGTSKLCVWSLEEGQMPKEIFHTTLPPYSSISAADFKEESFNQFTFVVGLTSGEVSFHSKDSKEVKLQGFSPITSLKFGEKNEVFIGTEKGCFSYDGKKQSQISDEPISSLDYRQNILCVGSLYQQLFIYERQNNGEKFTAVNHVTLNFSPKSLSFLKSRDKLLLAIAGIRNMVLLNISKPISERQ